MLTNVCHHHRRDYRPSREVLDTRRFEVAAIADDATAREFVVATHYAASYPAARERFGLYEGAALVGVAVFSHPMNDAVLRRLPCDRLEGVELGRLVLRDAVPANSESYFVARCFDLLRRDGYRGVVSFADPVRRFALDGSVTMPGHAGICYQALNAVYVGTATARTLRLLPDGSVLSARSLSKIRAQERGHAYAEAILERHGAMRRGASEDPRAWLATWVPRLTRPLKHGGNLTYLWGLDRRVKRMLPASKPYPKLILETV